MVLADGSTAHVIAGGVAGTAGAVITCPLEIVKTRLQSSVNTWSEPSGTTQYVKPYSPLRKFARMWEPNPCGHICQAQISNCFTKSAFDKSMRSSPQMSIYKCIAYIYRTEGLVALYKGLSMNILGVMPSRAIYFGTYFNGQELFSTYYPKGSHKNVILASAFASFASSTATNPIWLVKTRLQLDQSPTSKSLSVGRCIREIWRQGGPLGFYKGIQASYIGIAETALHFTMYEHLKRTLIRMSREPGDAECCVSRADEVFYCSIASMCSKSTATVMCYPHEVLRTRLRQEGTKYTGLLQTLRLVLQEEGTRSLYKGLMTHFARQIPNTCIVLTTYEAMLHYIKTHRA